MLTREQILQSDDLPRETVQVPEWGGEVQVRTMTGTDRDAFEASLIGKEGRLENVRARLVSLTLCDDSGSRLFTDTDIAALGGKSAKALDRVLRAAEFWVPNWYKGSHWLAYWDKFGRPPSQPKYDRGIVDTWWYDEAKAKRIASGN